MPADAGLIDQAADMLAKAELPLIHTGGGVLRAAAWAEVVELAEHLSAPVTTSLGNRGAIPEDHRLCLIPGTALGAMDIQPNTAPHAPSFQPLADMGEQAGKRHLRIRARSASGLVAGAAK